MHKTPPEISVIICTFNTKEITIQCLEKLKKSIGYFGKQVETIVVENGTDGTGAEVKRNYPWIKLLEPTENLGFAKGNNLGIKESDKNTKYFLFLNSDTIVNKDTLKKSVDFIEKQENCDVFGCKLIFKDGKLQPSAGFIPNPINTIFWMFGLDRFSKYPVHPKNINFFNSDRKVGWVMGAFLFMKQNVVLATRGFDENFFMYMEEVEWCRRIVAKGFNIWYTPTFEITHLDKASSGFNIENPLTKEIQGLKYFLKRYHLSSYFLMGMVIWIGIFSRMFFFRLIGDNYRGNIYKNILKEI